jgi:hypothetical protein
VAGKDIKAILFLVLCAGWETTKPRNVRADGLQPVKIVTTFCKRKLQVVYVFLCIKMK